MINSFKLSVCVYLCVDVCTVGDRSNLVKFGKCTDLSLSRLVMKCLQRRMATVQFVKVCMPASII